MEMTDLLKGNACSVNVFEDNKFYYKNGFQKVQLDIEDKNAKNIHPVKIDPSRIEGALKLIISTFGSKPQQLFPNEKVLDYSLAISEALIEAKKSELKYWKLSPNDERIVTKWDAFTLYKEQMFEKTSPSFSPLLNTSIFFINKMLG